MRCAFVCRFGEFLDINIDVHNPGSQTEEKFLRKPGTMNGPGALLTSQTFFHYCRFVLVP